MDSCITVGSRKSQLAKRQTEIVINKLTSFYANNPDRLEAIKSKHKAQWNNQFDCVYMSTTGDQILDKPLPEIGVKSLFTAELESALLNRDIGFVVHSLKDLPTTLPDGLCIGAVLQRDDPNDVIVLKKSLRDRYNPFDLLFGTGIETSPRSAGTSEIETSPRSAGTIKIGTSSHRRIAMIKRCNQQLECIDIRGNLNTRINKLDEGEYSAIIIAKAGLDRMGWSDRISGVLTPRDDPRLTDWMYAVGQGAIAVECRSDDQLMLDILRPIAHLETTYEVIAERSFMKKLEGGCSVPLGVRSTITQQHGTVSLRLEGIVLSADGKCVVRGDETTQLNSGEMQGCSLQETTGIILGEDGSGAQDAARNMVECSRLGIRLADRTIDDGCSS